LITVVTCTYNRARTLPRAIKSLLAQDYPEWELIIVDDGSSDDSVSVAEQYTDSRIRLIRHAWNKGASAAKNTGLDNIRGEWFTFLDSDDEMIVPDALSRLLRVSKDVDERINAVTCNCLDSVTGKFTGIGLTRDQYLDYQTILESCSGEFWGLTKSSLLQGDRFNPDLRGYEDVLWHRIDKRACRYYIHQGLRIYHTEGSDRLCLPGSQEPKTRKSLYVTYKTLLKEREYLEDYRRFRKGSYADILNAACLSFIEQGDRRRAIKPFMSFIRCRRSVLEVLILGTCLIFGSHWLAFLRRLKSWFTRDLQLQG
jgi:glycosyltransferase involved in cell wall biosynthesis